MSLSHDPETIRPSFNLLSDDDDNNVCLGVCLLAFSVQFECAYESGDCAFCSLTIYCSFLVYSDS